MTVVTEGSAQTIAVAAGKVLNVKTAGEAYVDRIQNLPDAGFASDRVLNGDMTYLERDLEFIVRVRAIAGDAECNVSLPPVAAGDIEFRRAESGVIDALIDPATGEAVPIGASDEDGTTWETLPGKPAVIAAGADQSEARQAIGAGTSNLAIGTSSGTAKAGDYAPEWSEVTGKPATFPPAAHTHDIEQVTGLQDALDGKQAAGSYATSAALAALEARVTALENQDE